MGNQESDDYIDTDQLLHQALKRAAEPRPDGSSELGDFVQTAHALTWLEMLATPHIFARLTRFPGRDHLLRQVDVFLANARSGQRLTKPTFEAVPYEQREPRAMRLRDLLEQWIPPDLPRDITEAARELLYAEGLLPPEGWDDLPVPSGPIEEYLSWPASEE